MYPLAARKQLGGLGVTGGGAASPWYLAGGLTLSDWVVVHDATIAASLAASYSNLINPGTNDLGVGVAPTWNVTDGWIFNGSTQYLTTIPILKAYSIFVQYSNYDVTNFLLGSFEASDSSACINVSGASMQVYKGAGSSLNAPVFAGGIYIISACRPYRDGIADASASGTVGGTDPTVNAFLGCVNYPAGGGAYGFSSSKIKRYAMANRVLTQDEITALVVAANP